MMYIIFLDIDGVLKTDLEPGNKFNESACNNLIYVLLKTGAKVVISSSWRHNLKELKNAFYENGLDWDMYVIGVTPSKTGGGRDEEIFQWIKWNSSYAYPNMKWVAVDDEHYDMKNIDFLGNLIRTEFKKGLDREIAEEIIKFFNK